MRNLGSGFLLAMDEAPPDSPDSPSPPPEDSLPSRQRVVALVVVGLVMVYALWNLQAPSPPPTAPPPGQPVMRAILSPERVPLVTGEEPTVDIFVRAGCSVCHTIPGIPGATGQVGPRLILGTTGRQRLSDPGYKGEAKTVHDYVVESVLDPGRYVVPGYPDRTMPAWYGSKLSALALEKIAAYLEQQSETESIP